MNGKPMGKRDLYRCVRWGDDDEFDISCSIQIENRTVRTDDAQIGHARVDFVMRAVNSQKRERPSPSGHGPNGPPEIVSGRWLVKALLATLIAAAMALYFTVCLLFYQGQWQFVFFPPKAGVPVNVSQLAATSGLPIADVKFDYTEQGIARLDGWWISAPSADSTETRPPASSSARTSQMTSPLVVLFCPNGRTTLPDNVAALQAFHALGVGVFAFDYRGFGQSESGHPSQRKAYEDGLAALRYLTGTRHIDPSRIVVYGTGVGTAVAVHVAEQSTPIAGIVLDNPRSSFTKKVKREQHIHVLPLWLIFPDRFDIAHVLPALKQPKLFLITPNDRDAADLYRQASVPKNLVNIGANRDASLYTAAVWQQAVDRFLHRLMNRSS